MKYLRAMILVGLSTAAMPAFADDHSLLSPDMENYIGYGAIFAMLILLVIAMLVVLRAFKVLTKVILKHQGYTEEEISAEMRPAMVKKGPRRKGEVWEKVLSLRPLSEENDLMLDHQYDGIQELNNPIPAWFMWLFYGTIAFAFCYLLIYPIFKVGPNQYEEYKTEVAQADAAHKLFLSKAANQVDENTVKLVSSPSVLASGAAVFKTNCVACHGDHAQGVVGPNLTDDYWLHGGKINDLFKTVKYGVLTKGMPTWEKVLSPKQISDVVNYVKSLHGTNPSGAKAPEGVKETDEVAVPAKKGLTVNN